MPADYPYARAQEQDLQDEDTGAGCERRRTAGEWPRPERRVALERRRRGGRDTADAGPGRGWRVRLGAASSPTVVGAWARPSAAAGAGA